MQKNTVLIIDDDAAVRALMERACQKAGLNVILAGNRVEFLAAVNDSSLALIIVDLQMPGFDGIELMRVLAERRTDVPVVIISGFHQRVLHTAETFGRSIGLNVLDKLQKPVSVRALMTLLDSVLGVSNNVAEADLSAAIELEQITLHYQPKVICKAESFGQVVGFEGLARWEHPRHGLIMPGRFIAQAEATGEIAELTYQLIKCGLRQLRRWGDENNSFNLALNLSPFMLTDAGLADSIADMAHDAGVDPGLLRLEVTESGAMNDESMTMELLTRLRLKGFELSIDDFGTGYSSLVQLYNLPFSELKVDRSFVADLDNSEDARVIARTLIDLAHNLSMQVCAEGVETVGQWNRLVKYGCDRVQGYFVGKPMPATAVPDWLGNWRVRLQQIAANSPSPSSATSLKSVN